MNADFVAILIHPNTKESLQFNSSDNVLATKDGTSVFKIINKVPVLLYDAKDNDALFDYREHYEQDAKAFDYFEDFIPSHQIENNRLHDNILKEIPAQAQLVLDVGCGGAWLAKSLLPKGKKVISMDISTINPVKALETFPGEHHYGLVADVFALPIKENALDCIVASEIIEHVKDPELFIKHLLGVLKPGGKLIITTPHDELLQQSLCIHCNNLTPHNAHLHSFTQEKIKSLVTENAGIVQTKVFNSKLLQFFRLHIKFRNMPFGLWRIMDKMALKMTGKKATRLMMTVVKK